MNTNTITVPGWIVGTAHFLDRNWIALVGIVLIALLASILTELAKHQWSVKYETDKVKQLVRWTLLALTSAFTLLGYVVFYLQASKPFLAQVPHIGQAEIEVLGAAWTLYNFRLNKSFKVWADRLSKWSGGKNPTETPPAVQPQPAVVDPNDLAV